MNVLIGCEFSGVVRDAFLARGHFAVSCDLEPGEGDRYTVDEFHWQGDVRELIAKPWLTLPGGERDCGDWDLMIAHPPCTYLCSSGMHWNTRRPGRSLLTDKALDFVAELWRCRIKKVCIENPQGCINTRLPFMPRPQWIQPWQFGDDASKKTGLHLRNLPPLKPTKLIAPRLVCCGEVVDDGLGVRGCPNCCGDQKARPRWANQTNSGQNKLPPSATRAADRARTYPGIAAAMAEQWGATA